MNTEIETVAFPFRPNRAIRTVTRQTDIMPHRSEPLFSAATFQVRHPAHELRELVEAALLRIGCRINHDVSIEVHAADVTLRGTVRSYYQKQLAQEALRPIAGLRQIFNEIEVAAR